MAAGSQPKAMASCESSAHLGENKKCAVFVSIMMLPILAMRRNYKIGRVSCDCLFNMATIAGAPIREVALTCAQRRY